MDDVLIIGSGFGGAIPAFELARAGLRVRLLERGPWRDTLPVRSAGITPRAPLPQGRHFFSHVLYRLQHPWLPARSVGLHRHGLLEVFSGHGIRIVCASGVGGGSHVYGGLHARPLCSDYWDGVADGVDSQGMERHYQALLDLFGSRLPAANATPALASMPWPAAASGFQDVAPERQPAWAYLFPREPGRPQVQVCDGVLRQEADFRQEGSFGSPGGGKTTLDVTCLLPALRHGLQVEDGQEALMICRMPAGGFEVTSRNLEHGRLHTWRAQRLILAAGTLNTVALLLRSRAAGALRGMPALGQGFGSNADVMAYWPVNTSGVDHSMAGVYERLFQHQQDSLGPVFMQSGISGLAAIPMPGMLKRRLRQDLFIAAMGVDNADGVISLQGARLRVDYDSRRSPVFGRIAEHLHTLGELSGTRLWTAPTPTTVHPLGGARLGRDASTSVINGRGEVHDVPGLFISDGSALPAAPGSPPSLSIAAWARHIALLMQKA